MKILISFCNSDISPERDIKGITPLGLLDTDLDIISWVKLPKDIYPKTITGLTQNKDFIYVVYQSQSAGLIIYNKKGLSIHGHTILPEVSDPHSILYDNGFLYVVSTGNDKVFRYEVEGDGMVSANSRKLFFRPLKSSGREDNNHFNSIAKFNGDFFVSGFGAKKGELKNTAKNGFFIRVKDQKKIQEGIFHPHSLLVDNNNLYFLESSTRTLYNLKDSLFKFNLGYPRGLLKINNFFVVGISSARKVSKTLGVVNNLFDKDGEVVPVCKLIFIENIYQKSHKLDFENILDSLENRDIYGYDFLKFFYEIYDLMEVDEVSISYKNTAHSESIYKTNENAIINLEPFISNQEFKYLSKETVSLLQKLVHFDSARAVQRLREITYLNDQLNQKEKNVTCLNDQLNQKEKKISDLENLLKNITSSKTFRLWRRFVNIREHIKKKILFEDEV